MNGLLRFQLSGKCFRSCSDGQREEQYNRFVQCLYKKKNTGACLIDQVQWATQL